MFKNDVELLMMLSRGAPTPATGVGALGTDTPYSNKQIISETICWKLTEYFAFPYPSHYVYTVLENKSRVLSSARKRINEPGWNSVTNVFNGNIYGSRQ
jgi:hypothetical protein